MALTDRQLDDLDELPELIAPILPLAGLANPAIATVTFAYGMLVRFVRLGEQIRIEQEKRQRALLDDLEGQGLFRIPIGADTSMLELRIFLTNARRRYRAAFDQLRDDVIALDQPLNPRGPAARERLLIAMRVVPEVYDVFRETGRIHLADAPLLNDDHLQLLNPGDPRVLRSLVHTLYMERRTVLAGTTSLGRVRERLPAYILLRLQLEQSALNEILSESLMRFNGAVRDLYWAAVFGSDGSDGALQETIDFAVDRSLAGIDAELARLAEEREEIEALPDAARDEVRLAEIGAREEELEALVDRVELARGGNGERDDA